MRAHADRGTLVGHAGVSAGGRACEPSTTLWFLVVALLLLVMIPVALVTVAQAGPAAATPLAVGPLPLHTSGRYVVNATGARVKLDGVNWYGADQNQFVVEGLEIRSLPAIAATIRSLGFNVVRLPFSNQMVEQNPVVAAKYLKANPSLVGKTALQIFDATIDALAAAGIAVVIDDHTSGAQWCCNTSDGNGLWWTAKYPESSWIADWQTMARRYSHRWRPPAAGGRRSRTAERDPRRQRCRQAGLGRFGIEVRLGECRDPRRQRGPGDQSVVVDRRGWHQLLARSAGARRPIRSR